MKDFSGFICGLIFGLGLALSGMTDTQKVIGFLDVFGQWIPDLLFVMCGAVLVTTLGFAFIWRKGSPLFDTDFHLPKNKNIDQNLVLGAVVFGIGWGLYGYCPGPALASLAYLDSSTLVFVGCMYVGMRFADFFQTKTKHPF